MLEQRQTTEYIDICDIHDNHPEEDGIFINVDDTDK
jgi:hypothetical protein